MTGQEIREAIAELEAARRARLLGKVRTRVQYDGGGVDYQLATIEEIGAEIARLRVLLARETGERSGLGPIRPTFGGRV